MLIETLFTYSTTATSVAINSPYTRLSVVGANFINIYSNCRQNLCASGQCNLNGNCLGPCSLSVPARINGTYACPTNYFDDGINAQC